MIVILSREEFEVNTDQVIDWLDALGGDWVRLNAEDLMGHSHYEINFGPTKCHAVLRAGQREIRSDEVQAVWFRRWHQPRDFFGKRIKDPRLRFTVENHLMREMRMLSETIFHLFRNAKWLTSPTETRLSKLRALQLASMAGLDVPDTLITNRKSDLQAFKNRHQRIITKCIGDVEVFQYAGRNWGLYTREITQEDIDAVPQKFFPTLLQERLEKTYEVRSFYLDRQFYSMAIFSQHDPRTKDDFRHYNYDCPNRCVPYRLPPKIYMALQRFMDSAELTTGSVDLVCTPEGKLFFLEVNPGGQFGMVSQPCNFFLEKKVAVYLMGLDAGGQRVTDKTSEKVSNKKIAAKKSERADVPIAYSEPQVRGESHITSLFLGEGYPLGYRLMDTMDDSANNKLHISESNFHRASVYANYPYHKAISRPLEFELPADQISESPTNGQDSI
jgi:ATP-GRASP peptide maturase of grasp-with-spasm system